MGRADKKKIQKKTSGFDPFIHEVRFKIRRVKGKDVLIISELKPGNCGTIGRDAYDGVKSQKPQTTAVMKKIVQSAATSLPAFDISATSSVLIYPVPGHAEAFATGATVTLATAIAEGLRDRELQVVVRCDLIKNVKTDRAAVKDTPHEQRANLLVNTYVLNAAVPDEVDTIVIFDDSYHTGATMDELEKTIVGGPGGRSVKIVRVALCAWQNHGSPTKDADVFPPTERRNLLEALRDDEAVEVMGPLGGTADIGIGRDTDVLNDDDVDEDDDDDDPVANFVADGVPTNLPTAGAVRKAGIYAILPIDGQGRVLGVYVGSTFRRMMTVWQMLKECGKEHARAIWSLIKTHHSPALEAAIKESQDGNPGAPLPIFLIGDLSFIDGVQSEKEMQRIVVSGEQSAADEAKALRLLLNKLETIARLSLADCRKGGLKGAAKTNALPGKAELLRTAVDDKKSGFTLDDDQTDILRDYPTEEEQQCFYEKVAKVENRWATGKKNNGSFRQMVVMLPGLEFMHPGGPVVVVGVYRSENIHDLLISYCRVADREEFFYCDAFGRPKLQKKMITIHGLRQEDYVFHPKGGSEKLVRDKLRFMSLRAAIQNGLPFDVETFPAWKWVIHD